MTDFDPTQTAEFETIIDFLRFGLSQASEHELYFGQGTDNAWDEFLNLILESLMLPLDCDPMLFHARLTASEKRLLTQRFSQRIIEKIPVPYLINKAYFCGLSFYVDERVLIPRSPIAELINQQFSPWVEAEKVSRVLDLCTGSACIAIACSYAFPDALIDAVDISPEALEVAVINREAHDLQSVLTLIQSDLWEGVSFRDYDLIISNPPYVGYDEMQTLPAEFHHEPNLALETAKNGMALVEKILENAHHYLSESGILVVEVGNSEEIVVEAFPDLPFTWLEFEHGGQGVFVLTCQQLKAYFGD